jgi:hypothetical protein
MRIEGTDKAEVTGPGGLVLFSQMRNGEVKCRIICDGYTEQLVTLVLAAGVRKNLTVTLQPLFEWALNVAAKPRA